MAQQLDEAGGALLGRMISELGISVHTGVGTASIAPAQRNRPVRRSADNDSIRVTLSDGTAIDTGLVVFATGVRPRDELARDAGLDIAERGGVLTDLSCATHNSNIFAVGEVAAIEGRCYGLVGPGLHECRGRRRTDCSVAQRNSPVRHVDQAQTAGCRHGQLRRRDGTTPDCLAVVFNDAVEQTYAKLVVSDDAKTLLGGVLVGDPSAYGIWSPRRRELPGDPMSLISPTGSEGAGAGLGVGAFPDDAKSARATASQRAISRRHRRRVLRHRRAEGVHPRRHHLRRVHADAQATARGRGCRDVQGAVRTLRPVSRRIVRDRLSDIHPNVHRLIDGTARKGLRHCKPAVASILASTGSEHILDRQQASLQAPTTISWPISRRTAAMGRAPDARRRRHARAVDRDRRSRTGFRPVHQDHRRSAHRLFGAPVSNPAIWRRLVEAGMESGQAYGKSLRTVKSCVGSDWCRYGVQDSVG